MLDVRLYFAQRFSALIMAPLVIGHLVLIIYATQGGLDAAEILARTKGSIVWALYYSIFVLAVSVHAAIGLRVIIHEHINLARRALNWFTIIAGALLLALGGRAVYAVIAP